MGIEIERKFLVIDDAWQNEVRDHYRITQGYLSTGKSSTVRVRRRGAEAFLTIKGAPVGFSRLEFEYSIPVEDAEVMLARLSGTAVVEKTRYEVVVEEKLWEIDVFEGANEGLTLAEIELESGRDEFRLPSWAGEEVSGDARYANSRLAEHPFQQWKRE